MTLKEFIDKAFSRTAKDTIVYVYEEDAYEQKNGEDDFSKNELYLAFHSSLKCERLLLPNVLQREVDYFEANGNDFIVVLEREQI